MHLLLVRHGETEWNVQRRIQGWTDSPLTERGLQQVAALGERLRPVPITAAYVSRSRRTQETGRAALFGRGDVPFHVSDDLKETSWGEWEGMTSAEISSSEPELWNKFVARGGESPSADQADWEMTTLVPGGESVHQASTRINGYVKPLIASHIDTDDWLLVVGHGGTLRFVIASLLGLRSSDAKLFHLDNASITYFSIERERTVLKLLNSYSHWSYGLIP